VKRLLILLITLLPSFAFAITAVGTPTAATVATGTTITVSYTVPATGDRRAVAICGYGFQTAGGITNMTATYAAVSATQVSSAGTSGGNGLTQCFILTGPATGANNAVITRVGTGNFEEGWIVVTSFEDVNQTTPTGTPSTPVANANVTSVSNTVTLPGGSDWHFGFSTSFDSGAFTITPSDTNITEDENGNTATSYSMQRGTDTNLTWTFNVTADFASSVSFPLIHDGGGGGGGSGLLRRRRGN
jgi:hypothetical protein